MHATGQRGRHSPRSPSVKSWGCAYDRHKILYRLPGDAVARRGAVPQDGRVASVGLPSVLRAQVAEHLPGAAEGREGAVRREGEAMTEQTKAQRLADNLIKHLGGNTANEAAAELRRLDALNAELVEALKEIAEWTERYTTPGHPISTVARRVIDKAKEQT